MPRVGGFGLRFRDSGKDHRRWVVVGGSSPIGFP